MRLATRIQLVLGFGLATALLGAIAVLAHLTTARMIAAGSRVAHTLEVLATLEEMLSLILDAETDQRGFLLTNDTQFLADFGSSTARAASKAGELGALASDNPGQTRRLRELRPLIDERFAFMQRTIAIHQREGAEAARAEVKLGPGRERMRRLRILVGEIRATERQLLTERVVASERSTQVASASYAALVILILGLMGGVYHLVRRDFVEKERVEEALRVSRERFEVAVQGSRDGLWDWDITTGQSYFSPRWKELLGYADHEIDNSHAQFVDLLHPEDRDRAEAAIRAYLGGSSAHYEQEFRLRHHDGTYRWILTRGVALRDGAGRPYRMAGSHTDITARKLAEVILSDQNRRLAAAVESERAAHDELKLAQSRLVQSEKLAGLGQMVAGVAHEINNPLAFVINNAAVLERDVGDLRTLIGFYAEAQPVLARELPELVERIEAYREQVDLAYTLDNLPGLMTRSRDGLSRIEQVVKDLRLFARLDEGDAKEADLNEGIRTTITIIRGNARRDDVQLDVDLRPLPLVTCYPARINQVVMNLLSNAIDATSRGGVVAVRSWFEGDIVHIAVADTGTGIDPAIRDRIFDPFFTTKPVGQGTGLGLSISYGIVHEHGGSIDLESRPGQGTTFTVRLPRNGPLLDTPADPPSTA